MLSRSQNMSLVMEEFAAHATTDTEFRHQGQLSPDMERLVGRAITDREFRAKLIADPDGAIIEAGFVLTPQEAEGVRKKASTRGADPSINGQLDAAANGGWD
jgi:Ribosomally synthesized peptide prototyped by Frankia Franean1_4349.